MLSEKRKAQIRAWQKANPDKVKAAKKRFYATDKGKALKRREDAAYVSSGGRAKTEERRALKPLSEARKNTRHLYSLKKRSQSYALTELDRFVLIEAIKLAKARKELTKFDWDVDHIIPISKNGTSKYDNIQVVPALWNKQKSNKHTEKYFG